MRLSDLWDDITAVGTMAQSNRLHHDVEVAQRTTVALAVGLVLVTFVLLAAGSAIYDIGKWLTVW